MTDEGLRVLVVDDEPAILRFLSASLIAHGCEIFEAGTGEEALSAVVDHRPDLILLDLGLPDLEGIDVTRRVREWSNIPIIILSVREQESDKICALDAGADDYVTKPFHMGELLARMRAAMRRYASWKEEPVFITGELRVDFKRRVVAIGENQIHLTPTEYDLLCLLARNSSKVMTYRQLLHDVWGADGEQETHMLRVHVSNLRRKIEANPTRPRYIVTEPAIGYRLHEVALDG
jgi:two-component system, OmpR family, KDP operon response regulator KdpE